MFIENLTENEKAAFLGLAQKVIRADGVLAPKEELLLASWSSLGVHSPMDGTVERLASIFSTRRSRVSALLELLGLAFADGKYRRTERTLGAEIAQALGFTESELIAMENWVIRQVALVEEAVGFWEEEA